MIKRNRACDPHVSDFHLNGGGFIVECCGNCGGTVSGRANGSCFVHDRNVWVGGFPIDVAGHVLFALISGDELNLFPGTMEHRLFRQNFEVGGAGQCSCQQNENEESSHEDGAEGRMSRGISTRSASEAT